MRIPTPQGERGDVQPRQGGLQGDAAVAPDFGQAYGESLEGRASKKNGFILGYDPMAKQRT